MDKMNGALATVEAQWVQLRNILTPKLNSLFVKIIPYKWHIILAASVVMLSIGIFIGCTFDAWLGAILDDKLIPKPGTNSFEMWKKPPMRTLLRIYIYNYTNHETVVAGLGKPRIQECGPYIYWEGGEKILVVDNKNGTVSYGTKGIYNFNPELSGGTEDDVVIVPNIILLTVTNQFKDSAVYTRYTLGVTFAMLKSAPFTALTVRDILWGYNEPLLDLASYVPFAPKSPFDKFGLMYGANGTSSTRITAHTGAAGLDKKGVYERYNGMSKMPQWTTDKCNSIAGGDGSSYPPHVTRDRVLALYDGQLCRILPLVYEQDVDVEGIEAYRFTPPEDVFGHVPKNRCFCPQGFPCAPSGTFNVSICQHGAPVMISFPHFYLGDPRLVNQFIGLAPPNKKDHQFFMDVQPDLGLTIRASARVQINIAAAHAEIRQVSSMPDLVLPVMWFEKGLRELPPGAGVLLLFATRLPKILRTAVVTGLCTLGTLLLLLSATCIYRKSQGESTDIDNEWIKELLKPTRGSPSYGAGDFAQEKPVISTATSYSADEGASDFTKQAVYAPHTKAPKMESATEPRRRLVELEETQVDALSSSSWSDTSQWSDSSINSLRY